MPHRIQSAVFSSDRRLCLFARPAHPPQAVVEAVVVFTLAYATAYGETLTIAHFPYYSFKARGAGVLALLACLLSGCERAVPLGTSTSSGPINTVTIPATSPMPHWYARVQDRSRMYSVGSLFYAIYFFVSFPMFYRMDENPKVRCGRVRLQLLGWVHRYDALGGWAFGDEAAVLHMHSHCPQLSCTAVHCTLIVATGQALHAVARCGGGAGGRHAGEGAHRGVYWKRWAAVWDQQLARTACWLSGHDRQRPLASGCMWLSCTEACAATRASAPRCMPAR